jgi:hypothetical protein
MTFASEPNAGPQDWNEPPPTSALTKQRLRLRDAGFSPIPVQGKVYPFANNTGILTKHTPAVDIDIKNAAAAQVLEALVLELLCNGQKAPVRFGLPPKRALLFQTNEPFGKLRLEFEKPRDPDDPNKKQAIEILCDGQQIVVAGVHPAIRQPQHQQAFTANVAWESFSVKAKTPSTLDKE